MKINYIEIKEGIFERHIKFSEKSNLIYSEKNSTGKTTLIRFILYALGFPIPSTKNICFEKCITKIGLTCKSGKMIMIRSGDYIEIEYIDNKKENFVLPTDQTIVQSKIFGTENCDLLDNILGVFYVDQEKGWTLLNRGIVIGKVRFNIEQLVRGLSDRNIDKLSIELDFVERQLNKYKQMFNVAKYQQSLRDFENDIIYETKNEEDQRAFEVLSSEVASLESELRRVNNVIDENNSFKNFIEKMKLLVQDSDGKTIPVNRNTIVGFDFSIEFLLAKRRILASKIMKLKNKLKQYEQSQIEQLELVKMETLIDKFDRNVLKLEVDYLSIEKVISNLGKKRSKLKKDITHITKNDNVVILNIHETVMKYAKELKFEEYINPSSDYIFTDDLKSLSGTILHKIVFSFKLAYVKEVQKKLNLKLPIILDSPSGREITKENVKAMIDILSRDFADNQIIIASIFKYEIDDINIIEIKDRLLN